VRFGITACGVRRGAGLRIRGGLIRIRGRERERGRGRSRVAGGQLGGDREQALAQAGRREDGGVRPPAQDGAFDFFQAAELHRQARAAVGHILDELLRGMPAAATDEIGPAGVEFNDDFVGFVALAFHHAETAFEVIVGVEAARAGEPALEQLRLAQARQGERPDGALGEVVAHHVPAGIETDEVIRLEPARDDAFVAPVAVTELEFAALGKRLGDGFEHAQVAVLGREWPEGENIAEVGDGMELAIVELAGELLEGGPQRFLKGCAVVLGDGFVRDHDGEDAGLGYRRFREAARVFGVIKAVPALVVLDREFARLFHEFEVAGDGARGDAEFAGHEARAGISAGSDPFVDEREAFPGGAPVELRAAAGPGSGLMDWWIAGFMTGRNVRCRMRICFHVEELFFGYWLLVTDHWLLDSGSED